MTFSLDDDLFNKSTDISPLTAKSPVEEKRTNTNIIIKWLAVFMIFDPLIIS